MNQEKLYIRHKNRLKRLLTTYQKLSGQLSWLRLGVFLVGLFLSFGTRNGWVMAVSAGAFFLVVMRHRWLDGRIQRVEHMLVFAGQQLARIRLDWDALLHPATAHPPETHPFGRDLHITGEKSLHRLLDTAISIGGSERLREWLLASTPDAGKIIARQKLVRELMGRRRLRWHLALTRRPTTKDGFARWDGAALTTWLAEYQSHTSRTRLLWFFGLFALVNLVLFVLSLVLTSFPPLWIFSFSVYLLSYWGYRQSLRDMFDEVGRISDALRSFRAASLGVEQHDFGAATALKTLCKPFLNERPSRLLRRAEWIASGVSLQYNPFLWAALNALSPWDLFFAVQLDRFKGDLAGVLPRWLETWYTLEALHSFANFALIHTSTTFPTIDTNTKQVFSANQLGHPLVPAAVRVANDFTVTALGEIVLVTGSNMSGKSTFLRTVGVNLVLALAGGPVVAEKMSVFPFRLFTSIQIADSLSDGISYFYAEVKRLKALLDALEDKTLPPLFYLVDEIFRGTNNEERRIGSEAFVRALAGQRGAGMISTHDLELVKLADSLPTLRNMHFREEIADGKMAFDYRLREGPSPTTNALKIMQLEGLPVDLGEEKSP